MNVCLDTKHGKECREWLDSHDSEWHKPPWVRGSNVRIVWPVKVQK